MSAFFDQSKEIMVAAAWRTATAKGTKLFKEALLSQLKEDHPIRSILMTEYGDAMTMLILGILIPQFSQDEKLLKLSHEMKVGAAAITMDETIGNIIGLVKSLVETDLSGMLTSSLPSVEGFAFGENGVVPESAKK